MRSDSEEAERGLPALHFPSLLFRSDVDANRDSSPRTPSISSQRLQRLDVLMMQCPKSEDWGTT